MRLETVGEVRPEIDRGLRIHDSCGIKVSVLLQSHEDFNARSKSEIHPDNRWVRLFKMGERQELKITLSIWADPWIDLVGLQWRGSKTG